MAWVNNEAEAAYIWFFRNIKEKVYDRCGRYPEVFMSDRSFSIRKAAKVVFQDCKKVICSWHIIDQNLKAQYRKFFDSDKNFDQFFHLYKASRSIDGLDKSLKGVEAASKCSSDPAKVMKCIQDLMKEAENWIDVYTKYYCHMGISTTGRAESAHSALKRAV
ncbi:hypothetical protein VTP01DRAFT_9306 [Rhizomucor pusillus]|uniref:uncharacterized protein n=1 Tax=Rhizomucor pusillus TaxID=4840 RepID=UPI00374321EE